MFKILEKVRISYLFVIFSLLGFFIATGSYKSVFKNAIEKDAELIESKMIKCLNSPSCKENTFLTKYAKMYSTNILEKLIKQYENDKDTLPLLSRFLYNIFYMKVYDMPIGKSTNLLGLCTVARSEHGYIKILWINPKIAKENREAVLVHELGHCSFELGHNDYLSYFNFKILPALNRSLSENIKLNMSTYFSGIKDVLNDYCDLSIMTPSIDKHGLSCYTKYRDYYYRVLFWEIKTFVIRK